jgi:hypothetical protein
MWESPASQRLLIPHDTRECSSVPIVESARDEENTSENTMGNVFVFFMGVAAHLFLVLRIRKAYDSASIS